MIASPIGVHLPGVPPVGRLGTARGLKPLARVITNSAHFALYEFVTTREYTDHVFARQYFSYRFRKYHNRHHQRITGESLEDRQLITSRTTQIDSELNA
jgi:hypothetical protein